MHRSLTDFISAGIDTVVNVGQGINKGKFLCAVLAAAIATNAIAQPLQVNAPREQLSLSNYEQLIEARSNVVMDNPIAEGQVITFLFSKPSTEFLEVSFGKGFAQSEAYAGVKEIVESDSFYSSGLHVSYSETGGIDANFTSVNAPNQVLNALGIDETSARRICEDDEPLYDNYEAYDIEISKFQGVVNTFGAQGCWETVSGWAMSIPPEEVLPVAVDHRLAALLASCRPE